MSQAQFITHQLESVEMPLTQPPLVEIELQRISKVPQAFINVRPIPQRSMAMNTQTTLQEILQILKKE